MARKMPHGDRIEFSVDPHDILGYEVSSFHLPDGKVGQRLEIVYIDRDKVTITEDETIPPLTAVFLPRPVPEVEGMKVYWENPTDEDELAVRVARGVNKALATLLKPEWKSKSATAGCAGCNGFRPVGHDGDCDQAAMDGIVTVMKAHKERVAKEQADLRAAFAQDFKRRGLAATHDEIKDMYKIALSSLDGTYVVGDDAQVYEVVRDKVEGLPEGAQTVRRGDSPILPGERITRQRLLHDPDFIERLNDKKDDQKDPTE